MITSNPTIGNEHFKCWLKKLDPVTRVNKMTAIAKTQLSAGLKGSLIKASLAQLSQRCQVMLIRLTDEEIKAYTRRKPTKRLTFGNKPKQVRNCEGKIDSPNKIICKENNNSESFLPIKDKKTALNRQTLKVASKTTSFKNNKLKEKLRELFGDDYEDVTAPENTLGDETQVVQSNTNVKNYFNTVNVNIYKTATSSEDGNEKIVKRKSQIDNNLLCVDKPLNKKLRIDVSISDVDPTSSNDTPKEYQRFPGENNITSEISLNKKAHKRSSDTKRPHSVKEKIKPKSKKIKCKPSLRVNADTSEEDPSIKELWSILGMESPTDRSENIRKSCQVKLSERELPQHSVLSETVSKDTDKIELPQTLSEILPMAQTEPGKELPRGIDETSNTSESIEPVCKISETFSLLDSTFQKSTFPNAAVADNVMSDCSHELVKNVTHIENSPEHSEVPSSSNNSCNPDIETILILDDEDDDIVDNETVNSSNVLGSTTVDHQYKLSDTCKNNNSNKSEHEQVNPNTIAETREKIGTIRVKNLSQLMDRSISDANDSDTHKNLTVQNNSSSSTQIQQQNISVLPDPVTDDSIFVTPPLEAVEERFSNTYKAYFNDSVENKIPKLGELLHLAVADLMRRNQRIKRTEQLSSAELIEEEKQRAEKDFSNMILSRAMQFTPLCEVILKGFELSSKVSLFLALLCRIIKSAEQIDSANRDPLVARTIIYAMLAKLNFKDKDIIETLTSDPSDFKDNLDKINKLIEKTDRTVKNGQSSLQGVVQPTTSFDATTARLSSVTVSQTSQNALAPSTSITTSVPSNTRNPKPPTAGCGVKNTVFPANSVAQTNLMVNVAPVNTTTSQPITPAGALQQQPTFALPTTSITSNQGSSLLHQRLGMTTTSTSYTKKNTTPSILGIRLISGTPTDSPRFLRIPTQPNMTPLMIDQISENTLGGNVPMKQTSKHQPIIIRTRPNVSSQPKTVFTPTPVQSRSIDINKGNVKTTNERVNIGNSKNNNTIALSSESTTTTRNILINKMPCQQLIATPTVSEPSLSTSIKNNMSLSDLLNPPQPLVPSSSHCHPFVIRTPMSGKMRALFGSPSPHSNSSS